MASLRPSCVKQLKTCELTNAVLFALGGNSEIFTQNDRAQSAIPISSLHASSAMRYLRSLCTVRNIMLKTAETLRETRSIELKKFTDILHFPNYVIDIFKEQGCTILDVTGSLYLRVNRLQREIEVVAPYILKYAPKEERHPELLLSLFHMQAFASDADFYAEAAEFTKNRKTYPYYVYLNNHHGAIHSDCLDSDFLLMFQLYKTLEGEHLDSSLYKRTDNILRAEEYSNLAYFNDTLEFLKSVFSDPNFYNVALIDTQNIKPYLILQFLDWLDREYTNALSEVVLFVDGREGFQWNTAETMVSFPIKRIDVPRIVEGKSAVDSALIGYAVDKHYKYRVDNFFIFSSDCDFLPLADTLSSASFVFCGLSGSTSRKSIEYTRERDNAKFILLDNFVEHIQSSGDNRNHLVDSLVCRLNQKRLNVSNLVGEVSEICVSMGSRSEDVVAISMLNQAFASFHTRITEDGCLEFKLPWEHWER